MDRRLSIMAAGAVLLALLTACTQEQGEATATPTLTAPEPTVVVSPPTPTATPTPTPTVAVVATPTTPAPEPPRARPEYGGALVTVSAGGRPVIDPYAPQVAANSHHGFLLYNALVQQVWPFDPAKGPVFEPYLATEYTRSDDGTKWTFKLRQGVTFNDGEAFNADDVVATVERFLDADFLINSQATDLKLLFKGITKIDDYTVVLDTGTPDSTAFAWFSSPMMPILPGHLIKGDVTAPEVLSRWKYLGLDTQEGQTGDLGTGTGPFKLAEWDPVAQSISARNPNYFKFDESGNRLPYLDEVRFQWVPDPARRLADFTAGELHVSDGMASRQPDQAQAACSRLGDAACYLVTAPHGFFSMALNATSTPQFNNPTVVQALRQHGDMDGILGKVYEGSQGYMWIDRGNFPDSALTLKEQYELMPWTDPDRKAETRQVAKALLAETDFAKGFDLPFPLFSGGLCSGSFLDHYGRLADDVNALGIKPFLECRQGVIYLDETRAGRWSINAPGLQINLVDPGYGITTWGLASSLLVGRRPYAWEGVHTLGRQYREVIETLDDTQRAEGYRDLERAYGKDTLHVFPQGYTRGYVLVRGCVQNYRPGGLTSSPGWAHESTWLSAGCRGG